MEETKNNFNFNTIKVIFKSNKFKMITIIVFIILVIVINSSFLFHQKFSSKSYFININDADRLENGNTILQISELQTAIRANQGKVEEWASVSSLIEINSEGKIVWDFSPDGLLHHIDHEIVERDGGYFFCDSFKDAIKFVNKATKTVEWIFSLGDINWTEVNPEWGPNHLYNLPCNQWNLEQCIDWSHLNDIDFKDYGSWEAMLVSIRNFNLIIEVNYTQARTRETATAEDICWYYTGEFYHQHNPDYLPNGNLLVVDSDNQRFVELNMTTKEIVWQWTHPSISWPRDCDLIPNKRLLITDVDKVLIINITSGEILQIFTKIFGGYEADYIESSDTILVSCGSSGILLEYDCETGKIIWKWGTDVIKQITYANCIIFIIYEFMWIVITFQMKAKWRWFLIAILFLVIGFEIFLLVNYYPNMTYIFVHAING
ncbi:MAG: YncE family protein [Candidatus Thorarchaeota archaeon]